MPPRTSTTFLWMCSFVRRSKISPNSLTVYKHYYSWYHMLRIPELYKFISHHFQIKTCWFDWVEFSWVYWIMLFNWFGKKKRTYLHTYPSMCTVFPRNSHLQMHRCKREFVFLLVSLIHPNRSACPHAVIQKKLLLFSVTPSSTVKS